jgi:hypothetical protein
MVCKETDQRGHADYYLGLPNPSLLAAFEGFEIVPDNQLPTEIDSILVADTTADEFKN